MYIIKTLFKKIILLISKSVIFYIVAFVSGLLDLRSKVHIICRLYAFMGLFFHKIKFNILLNL